MILVGKNTPDFVAKAISGDNSIVDNYVLSKEMKGKTFVLFFYPLDFTFVCPSEIISFDNRMDEFKKRNCEVIGVSVDSHFTHLAWKNTPIENGGIGKISYTLVSDLSKNIARSYGVLLNDEVALRGTFLVDKNFTVRHQLVNDLSLGRNTDEVLRMVDSLHHVELHGEVCPAGWNKGKEAMKPDSKGVADYLKNNSNKL
jgi:peroxiredoxin (alkyl hydroperoxide reductase subunit C)